MSKKFLKIWVPILIGVAVFLCVTDESRADDYPYLSSLSINKSALTLHPDETYRDITVNAYYKDAAGNSDPYNPYDVTVYEAGYQTCNWSSSNTGVATVDSSGYIYGKSTGSATISCSVSDGYTTKTASVLVTVLEYDRLNSLSINKSALILHPSETYDDITVNAYYKDAAGNSDPYNPYDVTVYEAGYQTCSWSSSNSTVATVDSSGYIYGKVAGSANITCEVTDGYGTKKSATVAVVVAEYDRLDHLSINNTSLVMHPEEAFTSLTVYAYYNDGHGNLESGYYDVTVYEEGYQTCHWTSSNSSVATVDSSGHISAVTTGSANIKCEVTDAYSTTKSASVAVVVAEYDHLDHLTINKSSLTLHLDETYTGITVSAYYNDGHGNLESGYYDVTVYEEGYQTCHWSSSNTGVATVDTSGHISSVSPGSASIKCEVTDSYSSTKSATVNVTVIDYDRLDHLTINKSSLTLQTNETYTGLKVYAYYKDVNGNSDPDYYDVTVYEEGYQTCHWSSSNVNVATVNTSGFISAVTTGNASIKCEVTDNYTTTKSASVDVEVVVYPATPEGLTYSIAGASVVLSWTLVTTDKYGHDITGVTYNIYKAVANVGSPIAYGYPTSPYTDNTGTPGSTYKYQVSAVAGGVEGEKSDFLTVMVPLGDVPAPESVELRQDGGDVEITWAAVNVANVLEYCLERTAVADGTVASLDCHSASERYYRDTTVPVAASGQTVNYTYSVWARVWMFSQYKDGTKASNDIGFVGEAPDLPPAQVRNFRYYAGDDYVVLKWEASDPAEDVVGYRITRNGWTESVDVMGRLSTSHPDTGLFPGSYTYTITALDDPGKDGVPPFREGISTSLTVDFVGSAIIMAFSVTPEIDLTNCTGSDADYFSDFPPIAKIEFTLREPSDVTFTIEGNGMLYPPIHMSAVPRSVSAEVYWPPDRCDAASLANPVLPGDYEITLFAWSIVPQSSGRITGRVLSRDVSTANDSKKRITKVIKTNSHMITIKPNFNTCEPDGMPNKDIVPEQALADFSTCENRFKFEYFIRGLFRIGSNCCSTSVELQLDTFKENLISKNLENLDRISDIDNIGTVTSDCNGINAQVLEPFEYEASGGVTFRVDALSASRDAKNQYQLNNLEGVSLLHGGKVYHISSINIQREAKKEDYYLVIEFTENLSFALKGLLKLGGHKIYNNKTIGIAAKCKSGMEVFP